LKAKYWKYRRITMIISASLFFTSCAWNWVDNQKINGVSFVAPPRFITLEAMKPVEKVNADWVAITPYAFSRGNSPEIVHGNNHQWWGEGKDGTIVQIKYAQTLGLKIMLKPHVWVHGQGWAGDFTLDNNEQWDDWGDSYSQYISTYAKVADSLDVEMLCIGTEYRKAATLRPDIWGKLIVDVRKIYGGKIVYAANWDNYENITFWDQLDYIGIDAYFPLSEQKTPDLEHLNAKWTGIKSDIQQFSDKWNKPIIFTEFGYRSIDYATDGHWKYDQDTLTVNLENQAVAYQSLFHTFWKEPWFHGGFLWKWHAHHDAIDGSKDKQFTPQNKPVQKTITDWYGRF